MSKHLTAELDGAWLDAAVAKAKGDEPGAAYSTDWSHGGPLIEREAITIWQDPYWWPKSTGTDRWLAGYDVKAVEGMRNGTLTGADPAEIEGNDTAHGETMLIAAMRAYVRRKLGGIVELP